MSNRQFETASHDKPALRQNAPDAAAARAAEYATSTPAKAIGDPHAPGGEGQFTRTGAALLQLQRDYGNHHVQQVVEGAAPVIQPKLILGPAGDRYEREADHVAQQVVSGQAGQAAEGEVPQQIMRVPAAPAASSALGGEGSAVDPGVQHAIQTARGGQPLPDELRGSMEQALGASFGGVRLHTDAQADQLNHALQARAFTTGQDIFFRRGEYNPGSSAGQRILAHELTHVVQQGGTATAGQRIQRAFGYSNARIKDEQHRWIWEYIERLPSVQPRQDRNELKNSFWQIANNVELETPLNDWLNEKTITVPLKRAGKNRRMTRNITAKEVLEGAEVLAARSNITTEGFLNVQPEWEQDYHSSSDSDFEENEAEEDVDERYASEMHDDYDATWETEDWSPVVLVTWNLEKYGKGTQKQNKVLKSQMLVKVMEHYQPSVIVLQEVTDAPLLHEGTFVRTSYIGGGVKNANMLEIFKEETQVMMEDDQGAIVQNENVSDEDDFVQDDDVPYEGDVIQDDDIPYEENVVQAEDISNEMVDERFTEEKMQETKTALEEAHYPINVEYGMVSGPKYFSGDSYREYYPLYYNSAQIKRKPQPFFVDTQEGGNYRKIRAGAEQNFSSGKGEQEAKFREVLFWYIEVGSGFPKRAQWRKSGTGQNVMKYYLGVVHTSPSNKMGIKQEVNTILQKAKWLEEQEGIPVVLGGDWYMEKQAKDTWEKVSNGQAVEGFSLAAPTKGEGTIPFIPPSPTQRDNEGNEAFEKRKGKFKEKKRQKKESVYHQTNFPHKGWGQTADHFMMPNGIKVEVTKIVPPKRMGEISEPKQVFSTETDQWSSTNVDPIDEAKDIREPLLAMKADHAAVRTVIRHTGNTIPKKREPVKTKTYLGKEARVEELDKIRKKKKKQVQKKI